jgi:hypothetical protein
VLPTSLLLECFEYRSGKSCESHNFGFIFLSCEQFSVSDPKLFVSDRDPTFTKDLYLDPTLFLYNTCIIYFFINGYVMLNAL